MMQRRHFLQLCAALPALPALAARPQALAGQRQGAQRLLILVYLKGGNDGYNSIVPHASEKYYALRPTIAVSRERVIKMTATHGLNMALAPIKPWWDAGQLAILQGIGLPEVHDQHFSDYERLVNGTPAGEYSHDGWLTRATALNPALQRDTLEAIALGDLDIRGGDAMGPWRGDKRRVVNLTHPEDWLATRRIATSRNVVTTPMEGKLAALAEVEPLTLRTAFAADDFGRALHATIHLAARMPDLPVLHVTLNAHDGDHHHAFDTHWNQAEYNTATLERLGRGLADLATGLQEIGRWQDTLVVTYDEFGRAPKENTDAGTHHGWANTQFVMGGRVSGGWHGKAPELIDVHQIGGPAPVIDYRQLYTTLIESWWGGSAAGLFDQRFRKLDLLRA